MEPPFWNFMWNRNLYPTPRPFRGRKDMVDRYFGAPPAASDKFFAVMLLRAGALSAASGVPLFLVAWPWAVVAILAGSALLVFGGSALTQYAEAYHRAEPNPTDGQMDNFLRSDRDAAAERAMQILGVTRDDLAATNTEPDPGGVA